MHDAEALTVREPGQDALEHPDKLRRGQRADVAAQRTLGQVLHGDQRHAVGLEEFVHGHHIGMVERARHPRLVHEAGREGCVAGDHGRELLERHQPPQVALMSQVDDRGSAPADHLEQVIATDTSKRRGQGHLPRLSNRCPSHAPCASLWAVMLCPVCHRWSSPADSRCRGCGTPRPGRDAVDLVLPEGQRVALDRPLALGRGPANDLRLEDPSISREHARIELIDGSPFLTDRGSRFGTLLDGRRVQAPQELRVGMTITLGDLDLTRRGDRPRPRDDQVGAGRDEPRRRGRPRPARAHRARAIRPRLRSGWSLKAMAADADVYVLKDHRAGTFMRLRGGDAALLERLDGRHDLRELVAEAAERVGPEGPARLAALLAELADRGLLADVAPARPAARRGGRLRALMAVHELSFANAGSVIAAIYRRGGYLLFTRAGMAALSVIALMGLGAFVALIAAGSDTPLVVARRLGLGALAFVLARLALVLLHELAHGLAAESAGRGVVRAGLKWVLVFPYAFVDVSDAWFDSVPRRAAITLAGPASDLVLGGLFALACGLTPDGTVREVFFQVAIAGYLGALLNLNPLLERDGYHVLADLLRAPGLRRRAAQRVREILAGRATRADSDPLLWRYGVASLCWSALTVAFAIAMSLRYYHRLVSVAPRAVVWTLLGAFYLVLALPLALTLLGPLRQRRARTVGDA